MLNSQGCIFWMFLCLLPGLKCLESEKPQTRAENLELPDSSQFTRARYQMVAAQIQARGIQAPNVLAAMRKVPRHRFVPPEMVRQAYNDHPLPIGYEQTISQPYIVAFMTAQLNLNGGEKVLEIGTGSGYQAAVLAEIVREVYTIEIVAPLAKEARERLQSLNYKNIFARVGDGYRGWPEAAPFDAIMVTAAPNHIPQPLVDQLKSGGRMILPVGDFYQELILLTKLPDGSVTRQEVLPVRFVPMRGQAEEKR